MVTRTDFCVQLSARPLTALSVLQTITKSPWLLSFVLALVLSNLTFCFFCCHSLPNVYITVELPMGTLRWLYLLKQFNAPCTCLTNVSHPLDFCTFRIVVLKLSGKYPVALVTSALLITTFLLNGLELDAIMCVILPLVAILYFRHHSGILGITSAWKAILNVF